MTTMKWDYFIRDKKNFGVLFATFIISLGSVVLFRNFLEWNEMRHGYDIYDPILNWIGPFNFSSFIVAVTIPMVFWGIILCFRNPISTLYLLCAAIIIVILRISTIYLLPFNPPSSIIPLSDPIINNLFYCGQVNQRDLFFSGHTANLILLGFLIENKTIRKIFFTIGAIVGTLLILQHVHYSYDVIAAPIFAFYTSKLSKHLTHKMVN
ncbi:MAG: phosphatase PAP2-related protein [Saprospiraceae bacterium]